MTSTSNLVEVPADPTPAQLTRARARLRAAGIDPADTYNLAGLAAHISANNPPAIIRAVGILASQIACPMGCGRKLDVSNKDALGLMLCPECMEEAETENAHSDGHHIETPDPRCPACQEAATPEPADADEAFFAEWGAALDAAEAEAPDAVAPRRGPGRPAAEKHDECPACGFYFTTPQTGCRDKQACARRASNRPTA